MPAPSLIAGGSLIAPPAGTQRITRDHIVTLARQGRVWEFVPLALRMLQQHPADHGMRLMVLTSYARLGLRTAAEAQFNALPPNLQAEPSVLALRPIIAATPADEISVDERVRVCDANIASMVTEAPRALLVDHRGNWIARTTAERWFRCADGNIVRRAAAAGDDDNWIHFRNDRAEAHGFPFPHLANPDKSAKPYFIEGFFPPWILQRLHEVTPTARDGYRTRLTVLQDDPYEALDGVACADLRSVLADDRVELFVGPQAGERLAQTLGSRSASRAGGPAIVLATVRRRTSPPILQTLERFASDQQTEHQRLQREVDEIYAGRSHEWWRDRYTASSQPLRVLIPTCRYSTFIRHSATDLADAFATQGWDARVLIEPDDRSHLSSIAYLRELATFQPDLVVLINYPRASVGNFFPPTLPFVCWLQDAMPHQFDASLAAKQGPFDFLAGYLHRELFDQFGFERRRGVVFPVAVSPRKFHPRSPAPSSADRVACEIAYASHQSETPDAMHARLVVEAGAVEPRAARIFEELREEVRSVALAPMERIAGIELHHAAVAAARRVLGADAPDATVTLVTRQYCMPMADRIIRHQTLAWAAAIAERRGWRLNIHGRGWERHPTLAPFARPELAHDDELRESYNVARVHLHASINWLLHQRIMECALSGGLPLVRLKKSDLVQWHQSALHALTLDNEIIMERLTPLRYREYGYAVGDHHASMEYTRQLQRLGLPADWDIWIHGRRYDEFRSIAADAAEPPAGWMLGELSDTTFRTEEELEQLVLRAVNDDSWRSATSRMVSTRVKEQYTTDALARRLHSMVAAEMHAPTTHPTGKLTSTAIPASSRSAHPSSAHR